jgi:glycine cleavage system H protein
MSATPDDRKYQKTHEWVRVEDGLAYIGITDYAQKSLGDIVFVELPEKGDSLSKGDEITTIESVKAASPIYTPVGGTIQEVNEKLEDTPELINQDPYNTFIVIIEMEGNLDESGLMDNTAYDTFVEQEKE